MKTLKFDLPDDCTFTLDLSSISRPSPSRPAWGWVVLAGQGIRGRDFTGLTHSESQ